MIRPLLLFAALILVSPICGFAQEDDIDAQMKKAMQKAMEDASKPASAAEMKKLEEQAKAQSDRADAEDKAEAAKQKAAAQAVVEAKGPVMFPSWTPEIPQFAASGPAARKLIDSEPKLVQTGTSPLSPDALCDAWDKFKNPKFSHERGGSEINHHANFYVSYRRNEDNETVKLEAEREAGAKITKVTISSPLPVPLPAEPGN